MKDSFKKSVITILALCVLFSGATFWPGMFKAFAEEDKASASAVPEEIILNQTEFVEKYSETEEVEEPEEEPKQEQETVSEDETEESFDAEKAESRHTFESKRLVVKTKNGSLPKNTYGAIDSVESVMGYYLLQYESEEKTAEALEMLKKDENIETAGVDSVKKTSATLSDRTGAKTVQSDLYKKYLNDKGTSKEIVVAVIDTGVEVSHEFLKGRTVKGYDLVSNDSNPEDIVGHGTHVAGIIADNSTKNVKIMPIKALGDDGTGYSSVIAAAIDYAVSKKVNVISLSLGGDCDGEDSLFHESIKKAIAKNVCVVVAAGNESQNAKNVCPAHVVDAITVSASDSTGYILADYSNFGDVVDIMAPGSNILSSVPGNGYDEYSGTSMATPFVSAAVAMLLTDNSKLTPKDIEKKLPSITSDIFLKGKDMFSGCGILNFGKLFKVGTDKAVLSIPDEIETVDIDWFSKARLPRKDITFESSAKIPFDRSLTATTSNSKVAIFDGCRIVPKGPGKCTITVKSVSGSTRKFYVNSTKREVWIDYAAKSYASGSGTQADPYIIKTPEQLAKLARDFRVNPKCGKRCYKLGADIDLKGKEWISIACFQPSFTDFGVYIGSTNFSGTFDGAGHIIKNLKTFSRLVRIEYNAVTAENDSYYRSNAGLFDSIENATIKNVGLVGAVNLNAAEQGGLLAGFVSSGCNISNCFTNGFTMGNGLLADVVNYNNNVKNCYSSAVVCGSGLWRMLHASKQPGVKGVTVSNCFFSGEIAPISLRDNYTNDDFTNHEGYGSIFGYTDCILRGRVNVYNCFSTAKSPFDIGFAEKNVLGNFYNCYYTNQAEYGFKQTDGVGTVMLLPKNNAFFKDINNFKNSSYWHKNYKWDFDKTWGINPKINNGYPYLKAFSVHSLPEEKTGTWLDYAAASFERGSGTKDNPYIIKTAPQLAKMAKLLRFGGGFEMYFKLGADIDLAGKKWFPIGAGETADTKNVPSQNFQRYRFLGNFDGNGYKIKNLTVQSFGDEVGFVALASNACIKNVKFENVNVTGNDIVGAVVGRVGGATYIINCSVTGKVTSLHGKAGGFVGIAEPGSRIFGCNTKATVKGEKAGGIACGFMGIAESTVSEVKFENCKEKGGFALDFHGSAKNCISKVGADFYSTESGLEIINSYAVTGKKVVVYKKCFGTTFDKKEYALSELANKSIYSGFDFTNDWEKVVDNPPSLKRKTFEKPILPTESWADHCAKSYAGGNGSKSKPYLISNAQQLALFAKDLITSNKNNGKYFRLINNINLEGKTWVTEYNSGYSTLEFYFDGNGKTVSNLTGSDFSTGGRGLFPVYFSGGYIKNLHLKNVKGINECGIVCTNVGTISDCSVTGTFESYNQSCTEVGAICDENHGTIERCSAQGTVISKENAGGIFAYGSGTSKDCYFRGKVYGMSPRVFSNNNITNCYFDARFIGSLSFESKCYQNIENTGLEIYNKQYDLTAAQMKNKSSYKNFDFNKVWAIDSKINSGFPYLRFPAEGKITYNLQGGKFTEMVEKTYLAGTERYLPIPTRSGFTFDGWYKTKNYSSSPIKTVGKTYMGDLTLYAKWKVTGFSVKFESAGGSGSMKPVYSIKNGTQYTVPKCTFKAPKGKCFAGWATKKGGKVELRPGDKITSKKNGYEFTLWAVWRSHKFSSWKTVVTPTCTKAGRQERICSYCKTKETKTLTKPHTLKTVSLVQATTSKNGLLTTKCSVCKKTFKTTLSCVNSVALSSSSYVYDGKVKTPSVTVKTKDGKVLKKDRDYTVKYSDGRKNIGKYSVKVTFKGNYKGSKTLYFSIVPPKTSKLTATAATNSVTAKWNKVSSATGYEVMIYENGKLVSTKTVTSKTTAYTFKNLKSSATYTVKVRAFTKASGGNIYGAYSSLKVTTKKG